MLGSASWPTGAPPSTLPQTALHDPAESLSKIEARLDNGTVTTLARHTVAVGLTKAAMHLCQSMPLGQRCVQVNRSG